MVTDCSEAPLHLLQQLAKALQRLVDRFRTGHVHPRETEQVQGIAGTTLFEKVQVACQSKVAMLHDAPGESDGSREASSVLVDVEGIIEVGNARPLQVDLRVHRHDGAMVIQIQLAVDLLEVTPGQGLTGLCPFVNGLLEFGEHGLPEDGAPDQFQIVAQQVEPALPVADGLQQVLHQQFTVEATSAVKMVGMA